MELTLDEKNFEAEVLNSPEPVLVDFWAEWCGPCKIIGPAVAELAQEYKGKVKIGKVNVDQNSDLAMRFGVTGIPNLKIFKSGKIVDEIVGAVPKEEIKKHLEKQL